MVFIALRKITPHIFYYKTNSNLEIDFIVQMNDRTRLLIQVCEYLAEPKTQKREVNALNEAMLELKLSKGIIVTRQEEKTINVEAGKIEVMAAWRFLLSFPEMH